MNTDNQRDVLLDKIKLVENSSKKIYYQLKSLQARGNYSKFDTYFCRLFHYFKRASLRLSVGVKGSVSIEASIAIPIFLFAFLEILSLFQYISVYCGVLGAMKNAGDSMCIYGYAYDLVTAENEEVSLGEKIISSVIFSEGYLETQIRTQCQDVVYQNTIQNGVQGISALGTYMNREKAEISIIVHYTMEPICTFAGTEFPVICRYYGKWWSGYFLDENEATEEYVYVTENGSVYHLSQSCTHLNLSVKGIARGELTNVRNDYGDRYKVCSICCGSEYQGNVYYITEQGERYHEKLSCSGLKRTVSRVIVSEAEGLPLCSRCKQNAEK